jgi:two-component system, chemotaxis family, chemotaxis protein CheY
MSIKVMVVDDSTTVRQELGYALHKGGFDVLEGVDGQDAYEKLATTPDVSLMICDLHMPRMDGLELLRIVKSEAATKHIPVLMLTTEGRPELITKARALGARAWLVKPVREDLVLATVKRLLAAPGSGPPGTAGTAPR